MGGRGRGNAGAAWLVVRGWVGGHFFVCVYTVVSVVGRGNGDDAW